MDADTSETQKATEETQTAADTSGTAAETTEVQTCSRAGNQVANPLYKELIKEITAAQDAISGIPSGLFKRMNVSLTVGISGFPKYPRPSRQFPRPSAFLQFP